MAFGPWTKVVGAAPLSFTVSGTLDGLVFGEDMVYPPALSFSGLFGINFSLHTLSWGLRCCEDSWPTMKYCGYLNNGMMDLQDTDIITYNSPEGSPGPIEGGPAHLTGSWSASVSGLRLKRRWAVADLAHRQHMHPTDASLMDAWFVTVEDGADVTATLTLEGMTLSRTTHYVPLEDEQYDPSLGMSLQQWMWHARVAGDLGAGTINGVNLGHRIVNFGVVDDLTTPNLRLFTNSSNWRFEQTGMGGVMETYGIAVASRIGPSWVYAKDSRMFSAEDSLLDPVLLTPRLEYTPEHTWRSKPIPMSELPDVTGETLMIVTSGNEYPVAPEVGDIRDDPHIHISVQREWALKNAVCPGEGDLGGGDLYVALDAPGVHSGVNGGTRDVVAELSGRESALYPLAADKDHPSEPANKRWVPTDDLVENNDPAYPSRPLRWLLPADLYTSPTSAPGGGIKLDLQTRYWERLDLLPQDGVAKDWFWPWKLRRCAAGEWVQFETEPSYGEDVFSWKDYSYLQFQVTKPKWLELPLRVRVTYSSVDIIDPYYACGNYRAEGWEYTRSQYVAVYDVRVPANDSSPQFEGALPAYHTEDVVVDLLCPSGGEVPYLLIVDSVEILDLRIPVCDAVDKPAEYVEGGILEIVESLKLVKDPGFDHTGRDVRATPGWGSELEASTKETWDFGSDFEGLTLKRDGNLRVLDLPNEPALGYNSGPEKGMGYIQHWVSCPTDENQDPRDYARSMTFLGYVPWSEGLDLSYDTVAAEGLVKDADGTWMTTPWFYWLSCENRITGGVDSASVSATVRVNTWSPAAGIVSTVGVNKVFGAALRTMLKTADRKRRVTPDLFPAEPAPQPYYLVYEKVTYTDAEGHSMSHPGGSYPTAGVWTVVEEGRLIPRLDRHGVWSSKGLPPANSAIWNYTATEHDRGDKILRQRLVWFWDQYTPGSYDINDEAQAAAARLDPHYLGEVDFGGDAAARRWSMRVGYLNTKRWQRLGAVSGPTTCLVAHPGDLLFYNQSVPSEAGVVRVDHTSPGEGQPVSSERIEGITNPDIAMFLDHTTVCAAVSPDGSQLVLALGGIYGQGAEIVSPLTGYGYPAATLDPGTGTLLVLAVRTADQQLCLFRVSRDWENDNYSWKLITAIGVSDPVAGAIVAAPSGVLVVYRVASGVIYQHSSADGGKSWVQDSV